VSTAASKGDGAGGSGAVDAKAGEGSPPQGTRRWLADVVAGASVGLVLIPQSMAYAELAGLPPHRGLFAGALPPILAAFFASSPYLQTGPVALTSLLTFGALASLATPGSDEYVILAALLAVVVGAVRVAIGVTRAGAISYLMSQPVLRGFTAGAALLIFSSQLPSVFGVTAEGGSVLGRAYFAMSHVGAWQTTAIGISAVTLVLMLGGRRIHALFPGVLAAVIFGVVFSSSTDYGGAVVGGVPDVLLPPFTIEHPWSKLPTLLVSGGIIALVGFAEAASVSQTFAEQTRTTWDPNKEFVSQGVANLSAGFFGGFPVGGSFSRSALNRHAGAVTRWSGAITGLTVLVFLPFAGIIAPLPKAVLGAIVVGAVLKLLDPRPLIELWRLSPAQALVAYATFVLTLLLAPHVEYAVLGGIALGLAVHAWRETQVDVAAGRQGDTLILRPRGVIWFASAPLFRQRMADLLAEHADVQVLRVDLAGMGRIDLTGALALSQIAQSAADGGLEVRFCGAPGRSKLILRRVMPDILMDDDEDE